MNESRPKVGVGNLIFKDGKILLGKRTASHASGEYGATGGHLEHGESIQQCARRETMEEAGIEIQNIRFLCVSNIKKYLPKHYLDIGLISDWKSGEPTVMEPDKLESWGWYEIDALPSPLFEPIHNYLEAYKEGITFFDAHEGTD